MAEAKGTGRFWKMKDKDLKELCEDYKIELEDGPMNRKLVIPQIVTAMIDSGDAVLSPRNATSVEYCLVNFPETGENGNKAGGDFVFVGHQGKSYNIPIGIDIPVPKYVLQVVDDAIEEVTKQESLPGGEIKTYTVKRKKYPYQILEPSFDMASYVKGLEKKRNKVLRDS